MGLMGHGRLLRHDKDTATATALRFMGFISNYYCKINAKYDFKIYQFTLSNLQPISVSLSLFSFALNPIAINMTGLFIYAS